MPNDTTVSSGPPPSRSDTPATGTVRPPTSTQLQELPFKESAWENFERLCLRLVKEEAEIEDCRQYGTPGQAQQGIDLYARKGFAQNTSFTNARTSSVSAQPILSRP